MKIDITKLKLSELIRVALDDLRLCEADPTYHIIMSTWHSPYQHNTCAVCLAGAVMAQSLNIPPGVSADPHYFVADNRLINTLLALDALRTGDVSEALLLMGVHDHLNILPDDVRSIAHYERDRTKFVSDMLELAFDLEKVGY